MKKQMTITNGFHNTEIKAEAVAIGEYESGEKYAEFTEKQLNKFARELCGGKQCTCGKYAAYCTDENDVSYRIDLVG